MRTEENRKFRKEELRVLDTVPKLKKLDLYTLAEYYCEYLVNKSFKFKIRIHKSKEEFEIDIRFFEENMPHLLGIQKVVENTRYRKQKYKYEGKPGYKGIIDRDITIEQLRALDKELRSKGNGYTGNGRDGFRSIQDRIIYFHLIPKLLEECKMVKFSSEKVTKHFGGNCNLKSNFILYNEQLGMKLQLGVVNENKDTIYYVPETFIPTKINEKNTDRLTKGQTYANIIERSIESI